MLRKYWRRCQGILGYFYAWVLLIVNEEREGS